ncbi:hypothetical protein V5O48_008901 [Marasmius crinis-equi]|uniref:Uncharacterized protein n=1 Tax=Marasmius crinis-equi TaxID=585013 RepID=A0ABR3FD80_9AGAR
MEAPKTRSSSILDSDVSVLIRLSFSFFVIFLVCVAIQAIYASTIIHRRRMARLPQLPFIFILSTSITLIGVYVLHIVLFATFFDASVTYFAVISPGPGALVVVSLFLSRLADFFMLSSLLSVLDYRISLFKRDILVTLFTTYKKRTFDIISMSLVGIAILAVTVLEAMDARSKESGFVPNSPSANEVFALVQGMENTYVVCYVAASLNVVVSTMYTWAKMKEVDTFRDETTSVLLEFVSPVIVVRAAFEISVAIVSSAKGFRTPFNPEVFLLVVTLVEGLAYVAVTILVLSLDGKMSEGNRRVVEVRLSLI